MTALSGRAWRPAVARSGHNHVWETRDERDRGNRATLKRISAFTATRVL